MFDRTFEKGCVLVLGGAKSGKSGVALRLCNTWGGERIFLATAQPADREMKARIARHQEERGPEWKTVEEPVEIADAIRRLDGERTVILLDCVTLWLSNLYGLGEKEGVEAAVEELVEVLAGVRGKVVVVSNELGMGIVPANPLSRHFRESAGFANQHIARVSRKVVAVLAGLPLVLKDE